MKRFWIRALVAITLCGILASQANSADSPFEINAILSLSGSAAFLGQDEADGLALVENYVNKHGGVRGRPIHFVVVDDQSSPQVAVQLFNQIVAKKVALVLGPSLVAGCNAVQPLIANGPFLYCLSSSFVPQTGTYAVGYGITTPDKMRVILNYFRNRQLKRIAIVVATDATGQEGERSIQAGLSAPENRSMQLVDDQHFNPSDVSAIAQMAHVKASKPDAIIAYVSGTPLSTVLRAGSDVGLNVPMAVPGSNLSTKVMAQVESLLPQAGLLIPVEPHLPPSSYPPGRRRDAVARYYDATAQPGARGGAQTQLSWDMSMIALGALQTLGVDATAEQVRGYMANLHDWAGVCCMYDFRGNSHGLSAKDGIVVRYDVAKKDFVPTGR